MQEKSGGKIILRAGGVVYLFRGRNYNYKTRPIIPLMLWKPPAPIYPKLIEKAPAGLTLEEANDLRKLGRKIPPICHLGEKLEAYYSANHFIKDVSFKVSCCKSFSPGSCFACSFMSCCKLSLAACCSLLGDANNSVAWLAGKNGVYLNLVRDVQNAFRVDDLVKVDCKRMNPSDFKKIGAKLKV